ncbi:Na+/H+ antiporter subunit A [Sporosarcina sp. NCCP-2716]|uniref:Na+/H+ antiporter subunit A n=1 Tax=Sporosarcina sp. NCCP-2716 TaxID=2943679 RepID=UPI00203FCFB9|nr:Na+/H+ antiporter subunit A [Sporosarcina sp. NCCP-2716]GKV68297.1 Na+/H+ antiporter subunit A [Sporosarcina sp. NCCP-2716]
MIIPLLILLPFAASLFVPSLYTYVHSKKIGWVVMPIPLILFTVLCLHIPKLAAGGTEAFTIRWLNDAGIHFTTHLDGLSMILGLLITGVGTLVVIYSTYYLSEREALGRFYMYLLLFMGSMLGVVFSDNVLVLYVFWELTSVSSFLLIAFWHQRKRSRDGAKKAMLITVTGGIGMLIGFLMLHAMTGTFSIQAMIGMAGTLPSHELFVPAMLLILLGAFTKSAQFPFHIWLPDAMEAPTPVSAYLHSATMVKAGIYLVARFIPLFGGSELWFYLVTFTGLLTLLWGSFNAVRQNDLKALLAYSTVSQLGLIMSLLGMGSAAMLDIPGLDTAVFTAAAFAGLFHLVNHSTFKGALFMIIGIVDHELGTRDIRRLGGLAVFMPITFSIALAGSFSMAGLPPFNGFLSKEMFLEASVAVRELSLPGIGVWIPAAAWIASVLTFVYCMIIVFQTFFGRQQQTPAWVDRGAHDPQFGMLAAPSILGLFIVGLFFFPNVLGRWVLQPAMAAIYPAYGDASQLVPHIRAWHGFSPALWMTLGIIAVGAVLYIFLRQWRVIYTIPPFSWRIDTLYNLWIVQLEGNSRHLTKRYMTGHLHRYFVYILLFFIAVMTAGVSFIWKRAFNFSGDAPITVNEYVLIAVMMTAAIAVLFAKSRLIAILLNGVLGFTVAFLFVVLRAPDLALTQIVVETVTTVLFLLTFRFLPDWKKERTAKRTKVINASIAAATGMLVIVMALIVQGNQLFDPISSYFTDVMEQSGGNIVNAILGDFRAFDTMLEIVVLLIGGLGVYALIKLKSRKGGGNYED